MTDTDTQEARTCDVDGCRKPAVADLLEIDNEGFRCRKCLQFDLSLQKA